MADGSSVNVDGPEILKESTFSVPNQRLYDIKKCSSETLSDDKVNSLLCTERNTTQSCESSESNCGVVVPLAVAFSSSQKHTDENYSGGDDRKKRCFDRYDSSESSDSGVALLSSTDSGGCSGSDITEPRSPRSPESSCSNTEDSAGTSARMPPWTIDPASPGPRRIAAQPAPVRRPNPPNHRRITEYFNHKMKPQNGLKRNILPGNNDDTKRKCLDKNGVTNHLEKYIHYLSKKLNPKVLIDLDKDPVTLENASTKVSDETVVNKFNDTKSYTVTSEFYKPNELLEKSYKTMNGFVDVKSKAEIPSKDSSISNGVVSSLHETKRFSGKKSTKDPSANGIVNTSKFVGLPHKIPLSTSNEAVGLRILPTCSHNLSPKKSLHTKSDNVQMNGIVSSTTHVDDRINSVTCGSNNLRLNPITSKTFPISGPKKSTINAKRSNRKSSACIANSKNLTWSKANNMKHVQLQKQNETSSSQTISSTTVSGVSNTGTKLNITNGIRHVPINVNGSLSNLNVPVANVPNCPQINISQPMQNGSVSTNNLTSFVAVPQNVMLTTLRIPQNGITTQAINQQNNLSSFNRSNVNITSPSKLNGQFVFPLVQNINGTVVQIPNLMAKMPNFVLPQTSQIAGQRTDLQNQQTAQFLINGTLLKLANTMPSPYSNVSKSLSETNQTLQGVNKNIPGLQTVGMSVQSKQNYTVNFSHPVLVPQPGFIVTSVPNINVKETWSYTNTNTVSSSQITGSNSIAQNSPQITSGFTTQTLHTSSIPIAPVKPPDNPIQGTDPPSSTVKELELSEVINSKSAVPWLSKNVNNNIVPVDNSDKISSRPFAQICNISDKIEDPLSRTETESKIKEMVKESRQEITKNQELRKVEEVERREETIFTQITVLKDVSSNVQNSVIEANFCSTTTESSESGIGTDKSIDSPSDSQTSKECDEDSTLSLSVSVCSVDVQSCQKSPILKQPKILRFPPRVPVKADKDKRTSSTDTPTTITICWWENCKKEFENDSDLLEHLQTQHVETQAGKENYVCLWERCKVRGKPSCSRLWLERHTMSHGGNKPFKCIVDGCGRRFSTQILLERHVNNHFNEVSSNTASNKKTSDSAPKLIRRNGKKLRYRRQPWSARMFDFFDAGMMEGLAWRLWRSTRWRVGGECPLREPPIPAHMLTLHAALTATRYDTQRGLTEVLVTYYPPHVLEDEWVPEKEVQRVKRVSIASLPVETKVLLYEQFCASYRKTPSPPPKVQKEMPMETSTPRKLPTKNCTSTKILNSLLAKRKNENQIVCTATNMPLIFKEEEPKVEVSGAKKRKMGRRCGGNSFWPCGR